MIVIVFSGAGCAARPESISASYISYEKFIASDCNELAAQMSEAKLNLNRVSASQDSRANMDAFTVLFLLIPVSQLSGDSEADVAKYKGTVEAIETAQIKNKCK